MRRIVGIVVLSLVAAGCGDLGSAPASPPASDGLLIRESPSPFREVVAGPVSALIPDRWRPQLAAAPNEPQRGIFAGPRPGAWQAARPPVEGLVATWVDGTKVGVPSDYYYLAASRTALELFTGSERCTDVSHHVIVDHLPAFANGAPSSPGDFVARGNGTCLIRHRQTHWAWFVAAPGYGPLREVGIPSSGLYVVVAVMPESRRAPVVLARLLERAEFNGASVDEIIDAVRPMSFPVLVRI